MSHEPPRATLLLALALTVLTPSVSAAAPSPRRDLADLLPVKKGLNVIVVSFDALRPDVLGAYGYERPTSPHLDAFAKQAVVFDDAYTVAPVTPTSFAAMFTGELPTRSFLGWKLVSEKTLATRLAEAGYHTAAIVNSVQLAPERGFDRGFAEYDWRRDDDDEDILNRATAWLLDRPRKPFLLWVHFLLPHAPYVARDAARHLYDTAYTGPFLETSGPRFETDDPRDADRLRTLYEGQVYVADDLFGRFVARLERLDLLSKSLVVVTADHGEELREHGRFQHGRLFEEHVRIPLIVRHPKNPKGGRTPLRFANVDLMPTLLHVVGRPVAEDLDGHDRLDARLEPEVLVAIAMTNPETRAISIRRRTMKLIRTCTPEPGDAVFDLGPDPGERHDLVAEHPDVAEALGLRLRAILHGDPCTVLAEANRGVAMTEGLDAESIEALRALGYI